LQVIAGFAGIQEPSEGPIAFRTTMRGPHLSLPRARFGASALAVVLCAALGACADSGHGASPAPGTTGNPAVVRVAGFDPCPKSAPVSGSRSNTGVPGLVDKLVPVHATAMRVCQYDGDRVLVKEGVERLVSALTKLETETNALTKDTPAPGCPSITAPRFFITFKDKTTSVDVTEANDCGYVTNGKYVAVGDLKWRSHFNRYGTIVADHVIALATSPTTAVDSGAHLTGKLTSDSRCFWAVSADGRRTDILWPSGYTARTDPLRVLDSRRKVVAQVGDTLDLRGGAMRSSAALLSTVERTMRVCLPPANCSGDAGCSLWIAK
jgi:hypothetical protein